MFTKYVIMSLIYVQIATAWLKFMMRENINEITKFLVNCQNFPYQIFLLAIANLALATVSLILHSSNFLNADLSIFSFAKFTPH